MPIDEFIDTRENIFKYTLIDEIFTNGKLILAFLEYYLNSFDFELFLS